MRQKFDYADTQYQREAYRLKYLAVLAIIFVWTVCAFWIGSAIPIIGALALLCEGGWLVWLLVRYYKTRGAIFGAKE